MKFITLLSKTRIKLCVYIDICCHHSTCSFFFLQENLIQNDPKNGVIVQQYSLALRNVNRSRAGNYSCVASNVEGDGFSDYVELKIMCK